MVNVKIGPGTREGFSEVRFDAKPSGEVRDSLKAAGFRWASSSGCWYGRTDALGSLPQALLDRADRAAATESAAPCAVRDAIAAESGAVAALRAELAELRATVAALRVAPMNPPVVPAPVAVVSAEVASAFGLSGAPASLVRPAPAVPPGAVKLTGPDSVASRVAASKARPTAAPKSGGIGRTLDVSAAGQWV